VNDLDVTLQCVVAALVKAPVRFHLTGGLASSLYGEPRFTQDIDVVVDCASRGTTAATFVDALSEEFLLSEEAVIEAVRTGQMFQAIHRETVMKVDFHTRPRIPGELDRSVKRQFMEGLEVPVVSKEDAVLSKLLWIQQGSEKSRQDVLGILMSPGDIDTAYLGEAARDLGVHQLLTELQDLADPNGQGGGNGESTPDS